MKAAIVDDRREEALILQEYLSRYGRESGTVWEIRLYDGGAAFLEDRARDVDLTIMDIDMPGLNGVETARELRARGDGTVLMFVTNMPQYALAGYEVDAVDYVLKPVSYPDFALKLAKACRYIRLDRSRQLQLRTTEGLIILSTDRLLYVESSLHYLTYHTLDGNYRVRGSMGQAEQDLRGASFARCNASFLVNLRYVRGLEKQDVLLGEERLRLSRGMGPAFMQKLSDYLGGLTS